MRLQFWRKQSATQTPLKSKLKPLLIVGLGNPGKKYENTWHNLGFLAIDVLAHELGASIRKLKFHSQIGEAIKDGRKLILQKPLTYMNESGLAVFEAMRFYKLDASDVIIIVDDLDLEVGAMRLRKNGSTGSHNGMRSIAAHLKSTDFARLRLGIGPKPAFGDLADFVLSEVPKAQAQTVNAQLAKASRVLQAVASEGIEATQSKLQLL